MAQQRSPRKGKIAGHVAVIRAESWDDLIPLTTGRRIYIPGSSGEPKGFLAAAQAQPDLLANCQIVTSFISGINSFDFLAASQTATLTSFFPLPTAMPSSQQRTRVVPISYFEIDGYLARKGVDVVVAQVSPPDARGRCSLGPCVEFTPTALAAASTRIAMINPRVSQMKHSHRVDLASFDAAIPCDEPLHGIASPVADPVSMAIAENVCSLIDDGATLQAGIGKIPGLVFAGLESRQGLNIHSGIISGAARALADAGAVDSIVTGSAIGDADFYDWVARDPRIRIAEIRETHNPRTIMDIPYFIAINSAIEVDLRGQCNAEVVNGKAISGFGGLPDFANAARRSKGGLSIIALPSTDAKRRHSRIVARLGPGVPVAVPANSVDCIVTEHGIADLREKTLHERAEALIAVADPMFRSELEAALS